MPSLLIASRLPPAAVMSRYPTMIAVDRVSESPATDLAARVSIRATGARVKPHQPDTSQEDWGSGFGCISAGVAADHA